MIGPQSFVPGNVGGGEHRDHARRRAHGGEVDRPDPGVRLLGQAERRVQRAGDLRDVVDVASPRPRRADAPIRADARRPPPAALRCRAMNPSACRFIRGSRACLRDREHADLARPAADGPGRVSRIESIQQVLRRLPAIVGARPHVGQRRVVGGERAPSPRAPSPRSMARRRARASVALARLGVAATPPNATRQRAIRSPSSSMANAAQTAEMSESKRFDSLYVRKRSAGRRQRHLDRLHESRPPPSPSSCSRRRGPPSAASATRSRLRSVTVAPSAISPGIESPIGEPFATLPPIVPALRIGGEAKRSHISVELGIVPRQRAIGVGERSRRRRCEARRRARARP